MSSEISSSQRSASSTGLHRFRLRLRGSEGSGNMAQALVNNEEHVSVTIRPFANGEEEGAVGGEDVILQSFNNFGSGEERREQSATARTSSVGARSSRPVWRLSEIERDVIGEQIRSVDRERRIRSMYASYQYPGDTDDATDSQSRSLSRDNSRSSLRRNPFATLAAQGQEAQVQGPMVAEIPHGGAVPEGEQIPEQDQDDDMSSPPAQRRRTESISSEINKRIRTTLETRNDLLNILRRINSIPFDQLSSQDNSIWENATARLQEMNLSSLRPEKFYMVLLNKSSPNGFISKDYWKRMLRKSASYFLTLIAEFPGTMPAMHDEGWKYGGFKFLSFDDERSLLLFAKVLELLGEFWPNSDFLLVPEHYLTLEMKVGGFIPKEPTNMQRILNIIQLCNPHLNTDRWKLSSVTRSVQGSRYAVFEIASEDITTLEMMNCKIAYGFGTVTLTFLNKTFTEIMDVASRNYLNDRRNPVWRKAFSLSAESVNETTRRLIVLENLNARRTFNRPLYYFHHPSVIRSSQFLRNSRNIRNNLGTVQIEAQNVDRTGVARGGGGGQPVQEVEQLLVQHENGNLERSAEQSLDPRLNRNNQALLARNSVALETQNSASLEARRTVQEIERLLAQYDNGDFDRPIHHNLDPRLNRNNDPRIVQNSVSDQGQNSGQNFDSPVPGTYSEIRRLVELYDNGQLDDPPEESLDPRLNRNSNQRSAETSQSFDSTRPSYDAQREQIMAELAASWDIDRPAHRRQHRSNSTILSRNAAIQVQNSVPIEAPTSAPLETQDSVVIQVRRFSPIEVQDPATNQVQHVDPLMLLNSAPLQYQNPNMRFDENAAIILAQSVATLLAQETADRLLRDSNSTEALPQHTDQNSTQNNVEPYNQSSSDSTQYSNGQETLNDEAGKVEPQVETHIEVQNEVQAEAQTGPEVEAEASIPSQVYSQVEPPAQAEIHVEVAGSGPAQVEVQASGSASANNIGYMYSDFVVQHVPMSHNGVTSRIIPEDPNNIETNNVLDQAWNDELLSQTERQRNLEIYLLQQAINQIMVQTPDSRRRNSLIKTLKKAVARKLNCSYSEIENLLNSMPAGLRVSDFIFKTPKVTKVSAAASSSAQDSNEASSSSSTEQASSSKKNRSRMGPKSKKLKMQNNSNDPEASTSKANKKTNKIKKRIKVHDKMIVKVIINSTSDEALNQDHPPQPSQASESPKPSQGSESPQPSQSTQASQNAEGTTQVIDQSTQDIEETAESFEGAVGGLSSNVPSDDDFSSFEAIDKPE